MIKAHVISDLLLGFIEFTDPVEETLPDCDLVFIVGNLGHIKRGMIYIEKLCAKYPNKQFIFNIGRTEGTGQKNNTELVDGLLTRQKLSEFWPKNLRYAHQQPIKIELNGGKLDILCLHGYPYIIENSVDKQSWKSSSWYKYVSHGVTYDQNEFKPKDSSDVYHGWFPKVSNVERCREAHDTEYSIIKNWLSSRSNDERKILVTALSPLNDPCLPKLEYIMYPDINPDMWIVGGTSVDLETNHYRLYGNSGRGNLAREATFII